MSLATDDNIILIGMAGVGKSTVGVLLAKASSRGFVDTDVAIQMGEHRPLQEILDQLGPEAFCRLEESYILGLSVRQHVIATSGSVVYSDQGMEHLRRSGRVVYLRLGLDEIARRIDNITTRGLVRRRGMSLAQLYEERLPLYEKWADITIDTQGLTQDRVASAVLAKFEVEKGRL